MTPTDEALSDCRDWQERHRLERMLQAMKTPEAFFDALSRAGVEKNEAALHAALDAHFAGRE